MDDLQAAEATDKVLFPETNTDDISLTLYFPIPGTEDPNTREPRTVTLKLRPLPIGPSKQINKLLQARINKVKGDTEALDQLAEQADSFVEILLLMFSFYGKQGITREVIENSLQDAEVVDVLNAQLNKQREDSFLPAIFRSVLQAGRQIAALQRQATVQALEASKRQLSINVSASLGESPLVNSSPDIPRDNSSSSLQPLI